MLFNLKNERLKIKREQRIKQNNRRPCLNRYIVVDLRVLKRFIKSLYGEFWLCEAKNKWSTYEYFISAKMTTAFAFIQINIIYFLTFDRIEELKLQLTEIILTNRCMFLGYSIEKFSKSGNWFLFFAKRNT